MPSSEPTRFQPLVGAVAAPTFRPFATAAAEAGADAVARAFEAGRALGRSEGRTVVEGLARDVADALAAIGSFRDATRMRQTETLVALVLEAVRKVAGDAFVAEPARWVPIIAAAIHRVMGRETVRLRVGPRLAGALRPHATALARLDAAVHVVEDPACADGVATVESAAGDVDASLAALREALGLRT